jgi:hypothetical protein
VKYSICEFGCCENQTNSKFSGWRKEVHKYHIFLTFRFCWIQCFHEGFWSNFLVVVDFKLSYQVPPRLGHRIIFSWRCGSSTLRSKLSRLIVIVERYNPQYNKMCSLMLYHWIILPWGWNEITPGTPTTPYQPRCFTIAGQPERPERRARLAKMEA